MFHKYCDFTTTLFNASQILKIISINLSELLQGNPLELWFYDRNSQYKSKFTLGWISKAIPVGFVKNYWNNPLLKLLQKSLKFKIKASTNFWKKPWAVPWSGRWNLLWSINLNLSFYERQVHFSEHNSTFVCKSFW